MSSPESWTASGTWVGVAVVVILALGAWLFKIDRSIQAVKHLIESIREFKTFIQGELENIWNRVTVIDQRKAELSERMNAVEVDIRWMREELRGAREELRELRDEMRDRRENHGKRP